MQSNRPYEPDQGAPWSSPDDLDVPEGAALVVGELHRQALRTGDVALHLAADALIAVQALFVDYSGLADRGSAQQQARIAIHNAIAGAFERHTGTGPACSLPGATPQRR